MTTMKAVEILDQHIWNSGSKELNEAWDDIREIVFIDPFYWTEEEEENK